MTDIAKLKAAAERHELLGAPKHANQHRLSRLTMEVHNDELRIIAAAVESYTDELIAALEAAKKEATQWKEAVEAFCADDADWHKLTTSNNELISQLSFVLCKQADRIAELEARTITLPRPACTYADHSYPAYSEKQVIDLLNSLGINLETGGE